MSAQSPVTGSLFAPFFFPLGIAFMGAQSAVMMKMAGENWQYGKRRISAMTNEEFNKLTPIRLYQMETSELRAMIPDIKSSLETMTPLTFTIVTEMINTFKVGAQAVGSYLESIGETPLGGIVKVAIGIWMPWLLPLLEHANIDISDPTLDIPPPRDLTPFEPPHVHTPGQHGHKTFQQIEDEAKKLKNHLASVHKGLLLEYTTFLAELSRINQIITRFIEVFQKPNQQPRLKTIAKAAIDKNTYQRGILTKKFNTWKKNNKRWMSNNNFT